MVQRKRNQRKIKLDHLSIQNNKVHHRISNHLYLKKIWLFIEIDVHVMHIMLNNYLKIIIS